MEKTKVKVKDLRAGDMLSSGTEIITGPVDLRAFKMAISVKYPNGKHKIATWGKYTTVTVVNR